MQTQVQRADSAQAKVAAVSSRCDRALVGAATVTRRLRGERAGTLPSQALVLQGQVQRLEVAGDAPVPRAALPSPASHSVETGGSEGKS